jgi:hypothetical protein
LRIRMIFGLNPTLQNARAKINKLVEIFLGILVAAEIHMFYEICS